MLTGDPPFGGSSPQAVLARKLSEPAPRLSSLRETVSPALEEAVRRALARIPADRFGTTAEFAAAAAWRDGRRIVRGEPAHGRR